MAAIASVGLRYSVACTTDFGVVSELDSPLSLPRLDMYYFRGGRMISRFGSPEFRLYVAARKFVRRVGGLLRGGLIGSKG
jgi:hypothetical protein